MGKQREGIRYEKPGKPDVFAYFTQESINRYDPCKAGWVLSEKVEHPAPADVVNFMKAKPVEVEHVCTGQCKEQPTGAVESKEPVDVSTIPTLKLPDIFKTLTDDELLEVVKKDARKTAVSMAEKELKSREQ